jgi:hypothetical protein
VKVPSQPIQRYLATTLSIFSIAITVANNIDGGSSSSNYPTNGQSHIDNSGDEDDGNTLNHTSSNKAIEFQTAVINNGKSSATDLILRLQLATFLSEVRCFLVLSLHCQETLVRSFHLYIDTNISGSLWQSDISSLL